MLSNGSPVDRESGYGSDVEQASRTIAQAAKQREAKTATSRNYKFPQLFNSVSLKSVIEKFESAASFASEVIEQVAMASSSIANNAQRDAKVPSNDAEDLGVGADKAVQQQVNENDDGKDEEIELNFDESHFDPFSRSKSEARLQLAQPVTTYYAAEAADASDDFAEMQTCEGSSRVAEAGKTDNDEVNSPLASLGLSKRSEAVRLLSELGLTEEHFSKPDAAFLGLSSAEELEVAIVNCKQRILTLDREIAVEAKANETGRRLEETKANLVRLLVALRLRLHELNSAAESQSMVSNEGVLDDLGPRRQTVLGHQFVEMDINSTLSLLTADDSSKRLRCDCCSKAIWTLVQDWHVCSVCGYRAHARCLSLLTRRCVASRVEAILSGEKSLLELCICPERGLLSQKFRCVECFASFLTDAAVRGVPMLVTADLRSRSRSEDSSTPLVPFSLASVLRDDANPSEESQLAVRQCDYSGLYYCATCHWNEFAVIPARVLHNWDFEPRFVCRASKQFLELIHNKAVFDVDQINRQLFNLVPGLDRVRRLRETILKMKRYFLHCRTALASQILLLLANRQHFVESATVFSLLDLIAVHEGTLEGELREVCDRFARHIRNDCPLCQAKAFICEICGNDADPLFLFDDPEMKISSCDVCATIYHKGCYELSARKCRKCARVNLRRKMSEA